MTTGKRQGRLCTEPFKKVYNIKPGKIKADTIMIGDKK
jgi:hypothetical protein